MPRRRLAAGLAALGLVLLTAAAIVWTQTPTLSEIGVEAFQGEPATPDYERGRALFVAKGCIACHWHEGVAAPTARFSHSSFGPNLSDIDKPHTLLHNDPEYVRAWLRAPWVKNPQRVMPNLNLLDEEIEDLLAFLVPNKLTPRQP
ncbi:MAG: c-type cytochrome [Chloroflexi bacterium]|nr:c-type cytochrome [Chloroflexota bacterium]